MAAGVRSGQAAWRWSLCGGVEVAATGRANGDFARRGAPRQRIVDRPWTELRQVHGADVVSVAGPQDGRGSSADAAVSASGDVALAVLTADCAPVALASPEGVLGVAHAGWRGLLAGVVDATVAAMRAMGATRLEAALGPCIHPECYEFGAEDLDRVVAAVGPDARGVDRLGRPALDLPAGVRSALRRAGATLVADAAECTVCSGRYWTWRGQRDQARQALVVWRT
jgi:YfiH family protein